MVNIAILGYGVVGTGTAEVLHRMKESKTHRKQEQLNLKYILVRRDFPDSPYQDKMVKDFSIIEQDPDLHIVVEVMGGITAAYEMTKKALSAGKSVVSSNKELVATHGYELLELAKKNHCNYLFEASVGGGIPILNPLTNCLVSNEITEIRGILNGTSNYILSSMQDSGCVEFADVLKEAQEKGFAEQDPSADVDGHDACRKICILANMAFGSQVDASKVQTEGIRNITLSDIQYVLSSPTHSIKLIGRSFKNEKGELFVYVAPHFIDNNAVNKSNPLHNVKGVDNAIVLTGDSVGDVVFGGPGAGSLATASAVMADVIDLSKDLSTYRNNGWNNEPVTLGDIDSVTDCFFVRFDEDLQTVSQHLGKQNLDHSLLDFVNFPTEAEKKQWHSKTVAYQINNISKKELITKLEGRKVGNIFRYLK